MVTACRNPRARNAPARIAVLSAAILAIAARGRAQLAATPAWTSPETDDTRALAWGDFDRDGDLDLAVANCCAEPVRVYAADGGSLVLAWSSSPGLDAGSIAWGDLDGDADLDLAVGTTGADVVYRNDGAGFALAWSSPEVEDTRSVAWADLDGDADLDLAAGGPGNPIRVYENVGGALALVWSSAEVGDTRAVAWGDFDGDADLDLAVGDHAEPNRLYRNDAGTLTLAWSSPETDRTQALAWGDRDADGLLDLVVGNQGEPTRLYRSDGVGLVLVWSSAEVDDTRSIAFGDWSGDGSPDLATGTAAGQPLRLYRAYNPPGFVLDAAAPAELDDSTSVAWADWDRDGSLDLAVGNCCGLPNRVYRGLPADYEVVILPTARPDVYPNLNSVAWGDADGDGDLDLATGNSFGGLSGSTPWENLVYRNDAGTLTVAWSSVEKDLTLAVAWGDMDGDGDLDLAVGNSDKPDRLYRNDGGFSFTAVWASADVDVTVAVAWGDVDGDGDLDLLVANDGSEGRLYGNDGTGGMTPLQSLTDIARARGADWGDWDGDGDLDLALGGILRDHTRVYGNVGGRLAIAWVSPDPLDVADLAWVDWDLDGDLDLAVSSYRPPTDLRIFRNDCGTLELVWWSAESTRYAGDLEVGDMDQDGDPEIVLAREWDLIVYRDDGGFLTAAVTSPPFAGWNTIRSISLGDYDLDGDLDVAAGDGGDTDVWFPSYVFRNNRVRDPAGLPETPVRPVAVLRPGTTAAAGHQSSAEVLSSPVLVPYALADREGDRARRIVAEYSLHSGGRFYPATEAAGGDGTTDLAASPGGTPHVFAWDAAADGASGDEVAFRITVPAQAPEHAAFPLQHGALSAISPRFRLPIPPRAQLAIGKSASPPGPVAPGDVVTFTITAENTGSADALGVDLIDVLDDPNLGAVSNLQCPPPAVGDIDLSGPAPVVSCRGASVGAGAAPVAMSFEVAVARRWTVAAPGPQQVCNRARLTYECSVVAAESCVEVVPRFPAPVLTKAPDGFDDTDGDGLLDPGEGIWFRIEVCHPAASDAAEYLLDVEEALGPGTTGSYDRASFSEGTLVDRGAGFRVEGIGLGPGECAAISFRTWVAAGVKPGDSVCNLATTRWTDPLTGIEQVLVSNGDDIASPSACFVVGSPLAPRPLLTKAPDGFDDANGNGRLDAGEGIWFEITLCHPSPSGVSEYVLDLTDWLAAGTSGSWDRLSTTAGTPVDLGAGFRIDSIGLVPGACATITFRTWVAAGAPPGAGVCNAASVVWTDPGTGLPETIWTNDDDPASPTACFEVGGPCLLAALTARTGLLAVKDGAGGAAFRWDADPAAPLHHLNSVLAKTDLVTPGPHRTPVPGAVGVAECDAIAPAAGCTDADALRDPPSILYYQVVSACGPDGASEGPVM